MPVLDQVAGDYQDEVSFVAVAGRGPLDRTEAAAAELFSSNLVWGLDESVWELYGVFGQPYTVLITGDDRVVGEWFGAVGASEIRTQLDTLISYGV